MKKAMRYKIQIYPRPQRAPKKCFLKVYHDDLIGAYTQQDLKHFDQLFHSF